MENRCLSLIKNQFMVILYLSGFSDIAGGGQISFMLLLKNLDRSKFNPVVICPAEGEVLRMVSQMGIRGLFLESPDLKSFRVWRVFLYISALKRLVKECQAGILHCDTLNLAFLAGCAVFPAKIPLIFHARVSGSGGLLDKIVPALSSKIICVSQAVARRFKNISGYNDKVRIIYNGVDVGQFSADLSGLEFRKELSIAADELVVGYCGQIIKEKGLECLLKAFKIVKRDFPDAKLVIAGRGGFLPELKELARETGIEHSVIFAGFRRDMPSVMSALDIFVLPTKWGEGFSRVIIEAMACGKPVITTDIGGNIEAVEDGKTGRIFPADDHENLAGIISALLRDKDGMKIMAKNAGVRAAEKFSITKTAEQINALYEEISCGGNQRGG